jgi:hypothetical protein
VTTQQGRGPDAGRGTGEKRARWIFAAWRYRDQCRTGLPCQLSGTIDVLVPFSVPAPQLDLFWQRVWSRLIDWPQISTGGRLVTLCVLLFLLVWLASSIALSLGVFSLLNGVRRTKKERWRRVRPLAAVPVLSFVSVVALYLAVASQGDHPSPPAFDPLLVSFWVVLMVGILASSVCVATVARDVDCAIGVLKFGKRIARITSVMLFVMVALYTAIALVLFETDTGGSFTSWHLVWWCSSLILVLFPTSASFASAHVAHRAWRVTDALSSSV